MKGVDLRRDFNAEQAGREMYQLISELFPLCRSITGSGIPETLSLINHYIALQLSEVPTGTMVFDWTLPGERNLSDGYVKISKGERIIDFKKNNLHVASYGVPVWKNVSLNELKQHLFSLPDYPDWIPYHTSYYKGTWGFCLSHRQFLDLPKEEYETCIDASLARGHLTYGEYFIKGKSSETRPTNEPEKVNGSV